MTQTKMKDPNLDPDLTLDEIKRAVSFTKAIIKKVENYTKYYSDVSLVGVLKIKIPCGEFSIHYTKDQSNLDISEGIFIKKRNTVLLMVHKITNMVVNPHNEQFRILEYSDMDSWEHDILNFDTVYDVWPHDPKFQTAAKCEQVLNRCKFNGKVIEYITENKITDKLTSIAINMCKQQIIQKEGKSTYHYSGIIEYGGVKLDLEATAIKTQNIHWTVILKDLNQNDRILFNVKFGGTSQAFESYHLDESWINVVNLLYHSIENGISLDKLDAKLQDDSERYLVSDEIKMIINKVTG